MRFFSYDPNGDGYQTHKTDAEAKDAAKSAIDAEREEAQEGWDDSVTEICWGKVVQRASEVALPEKGNDCVDYILHDVA
jgi:hypothetical protein